ncbi:MAG: alkaline phosphatase family protein [Anaerolineae bacterium]|nr:alkaline phosphatase family protein [Anaerolineae bacterium]
MNVLILAVDGASPDLVGPWATQGQLPNLARLIDQGVWGPLESTLPPMTSPAWPSFATGRFPAGHGVFDFVSARAGNFNIVNATAIQSPTLWDILSAYGRRIGVMNVPVTYPPRPVNGFMITGLLSPNGAQIAHPADLLSQLDIGNRYRVMPVVQYKPGREQALLADLLDLIDTRARFAARLIDRHRPDFMMVHFLATDIAQHALWRFMDPAHPAYEPGNPFQDAILQVYQRVDAAIGQLLDLTDQDTTVLVMSDHGFGPLHGVVNLNMLLWQKELLQFKRDALTRLKLFMFRRGLTPSTIYRWLERFGLQNLVARVSKSARNAVFNKFLSFNDVDWNRTLAYSLGHMGQIYINVKGREPRGIVERGSGYDRVCDQVIDALRTLTTPDGRSMLERVVRAGQLAPGAHMDEGPDLHVVLDGYRYISCPLFANDGHVLSRQIRGDSGSHRQNGLLIAAGPPICPGAAIQGARIVDLAPTVLHLMGLPAPAEMDGRVLRDILTSPGDFEAAQYDQDAAAPPIHDLTDHYTLTDEEEAELEARLKGLGYLG